MTCRPELKSTSQVSRPEDSSVNRRRVLVSWVQGEGAAVNHTAAVTILIGIILLIFGRRLFWFFVGAAGFLVGINIAQQLTNGPESMRLVVALVAGVIGALLALVLQKVAIAVAGFIIGGYVAVELLTLYGAALPAARFHYGAYWIPFLVGGIIGALVMILLFDWALIVLSSLGGASLILHGAAVQRTAMAVLHIILVILGIMVQAHLLRRPRAR